MHRVSVRSELQSGLRHVIPTSRLFSGTHLMPSRLCTLCGTAGTTSSNSCSHSKHLIFACFQSLDLCFAMPSPHKLLATSLRLWHAGSNRREERQPRPVRRCLCVPQEAFKDA